MIFAVKDLQVLRGLEHIYSSTCQKPQRAKYKSSNCESGRRCSISAVVSAGGAKQMLHIILWSHYSIARVKQTMWRVKFLIFVMISI